MAAGPCARASRLLACRSRWRAPQSRSGDQRSSRRRQGAPARQRRAASLRADTSRVSLSQFYTGRAEYSARARFGPDRLFVAVTCLVTGLGAPFEALLDTAAHWCLLPPRMAEQIGLDTTPDPQQSPL